LFDLGGGNSYGQLFAAAKMVSNYKLGSHGILCIAIYWFEYSDLRANYPTHDMLTYPALCCQNQSAPVL
jgi:hypothetical protein